MSRPDVSPGGTAIDPRLSRSLGIPNGDPEREGTAGVRLYLQAPRPWQISA